MTTEEVAKELKEAITKFKESLKELWLYKLLNMILDKICKGE